MVPRHIRNISSISIATNARDEQIGFAFGADHEVVISETVRTPIRSAILYAGEGTSLCRSPHTLLRQKDDSRHHTDTNYLIPYIKLRSVQLQLMGSRSDGAMVAAVPSFPTSDQNLTFSFFFC